MFDSLVSGNSLSIWAIMVPVLEEVIRSKCCVMWDKNEDATGKSICSKPSSFNACSLMVICAHEACQLRTGPEAEGEDQQRIPNARVKQRSARDSHHKFRGYRYLSISCPNRMSMVIGLARARHHDSTILESSGVGSI